MGSGLGPIGLGLSVSTVPVVKLEQVVDFAIFEHGELVVLLEKAGF